MARRGRRGWLLGTSLAAYRLLLLTYPRRFRREWGADMAQVFGDACRDAARCRGTRGLRAVWGATLLDWTLTLPREYAAGLARPRGGAHGAWRPRCAAFQPVAAGRLRGRSSRMAGNDRFNHFTERARRVLELAQAEAQGFQHNYIGTEHLLLGLIREGNGVGAKVLTNLGVELERVRRAVEFIIGRGDRIVLGEIGLTPRSKQVIHLAEDEARKLGHHYVGTEHLLLGLVREGNGIAAGVLESLGVNLETARAETLRVLRQAPPPPDDAPGPGAAPLPEPRVPPEEPAQARRMTPAMRRTLVLAQEEAQRFNHNYIGTEHLLLGLLREPGDVAAQVMERLGIELEAVRRAVEHIIGRGDRIVLGQVRLTPRAKKVIQLAADEARHLGKELVGTEHLLLGLVREGEGIAAGVLESQGASLERVREETLRALKGADDGHDGGPDDNPPGPNEPGGGPDAGTGQV